MTTKIPIYPHALDDTVYESSLEAELSMTNAHKQGCIVVPAPTGADIGYYCRVYIPQDYVSTPIISLVGVLKGTPANNLAFGVKQVGVGESETIDVAYDTEDLGNNNVWTGYADEDVFTLNITLTPASAYAPGDIVDLYIYTDDSADSRSAFSFLVLETLFVYTEG